MELDAARANITIPIAVGIRVPKQAKLLIRAKSVPASIAVGGKEVHVETGADGFANFEPDTCRFVSDEGYVACLLSNVPIQAGFPWKKVEISIRPGLKPTEVRLVNAEPECPFFIELPQLLLCLNLALFLTCWSILWLRKTKE
jgi:hypothetical protein